MLVEGVPVEYRKQTDILPFINGIPMVLFELKNPADGNATIRKAYEQISTYKATIPSLIAYNEICVISDAYYPDSRAVQ